MSTTTETTTSTDTYRIAVIGAGGKMGMRVSDNLVKTHHLVSYSENSPAGQERVAARRPRAHRHPRRRARR